MQQQLNLYRGIGADKLSAKQCQIRKENQLHIRRNIYNSSPIILKIKTPNLFYYFFKVEGYIELDYNISKKTIYIGQRLKG